MGIQDVIDAINIATKYKDGHYILHRSMEQEPVKIYRKFLYVLYLVQGEKKTKVLTQQRIVRVPAVDLETVWDCEDKIFLKHLLEWFKYGKLEDESISDTNN